LRRNACAVSVPSTVETTIVAKASVSDRVSASPIGSGAIRLGGAKPSTCWYQKVDHSMIGNCGPPSGPFWKLRIAITTKGP